MASPGPAGRAARRRARIAKTSRADAAAVLAARGLVSRLHIAWGSGFIRFTMSNSGAGLPGRIEDRLGIPYSRYVLYIYIYVKQYLGARAARF